MRKFLFLLLSALLIFFVMFYVTKTEMPQEGEPPLLLSNQLREDLRLHYLRAIDEAQHSITLMVYTLTDPKLIAALKPKAQEGVKVTIITDGKASKNLELRLDPSIELTKKKGKGIMHHKILVVDGNQVWMGSANWTTESLRMHGNLIAGIESKAIAEAIEDPKPHQTFTIGGQEVELSFLPQDKKAVHRIKKLIRGANKTIKVAMFTWTRKDFAHAIVDAAKRGVDVQVVMDSNAGKGVGAGVVRILKKGGVPVRLSQGGGLLHHKFLYVDGNTLVNGSANWTKAAFTQNNDSFMILHNLTEQQQKQMNRLWKVIQLESKE